MKKLSLIFGFLWCFTSLIGQNCIDAVIIRINHQNGNTSDTIFCKVLNEDATYYTIDNGYAISTISKNMVIDVQRCLRDMTAFEIYKYKGFDEVTFDDFTQRNTAGTYLRKAAFNAYLATGLAFAGGTSLTLGFTIFNESKSKTAWIIGGGILTGASLFFIIRGWNQIYKAGKIYDLKGNASLHLGPSQNGDLGLQLKF